MTYDCPISKCLEKFDSSRAAAMHVRHDHQLRFEGQPSEFEDLGIHPPPKPWYRSWNQRIPRLRPRFLP